MKKAFCDHCTVEISKESPSAFGEFQFSISNTQYTIKAQSNDINLDLCVSCYGEMLKNKDSRPRLTSK